jgi:hypothetical protein
MDAATIAAKIYYGYAKSAQYIGLPFRQFRPTGVSNPTAGAALATLNAVATVGTTGFSFTKSPAHKDALFTMLVDGTQVRVGDYMVGATDTYFIAAMQPLLPILAVRCNAVLNIVGAGPSPQPIGPTSAYGGTTAADEGAILTGWPASLLYDARGRQTEVGLPTDLPSPFYDILLPITPEGIDLRTTEFADDALGRRYTISSSELTQFGWRLTAQIAIT